MMRIRCVISVPCRPHLVDAEELGDKARSVVCMGLRDIDGVGESKIDSHVMEECLENC